MTLLKPGMTAKIVLPDGSTFVVKVETRGQPDPTPDTDEPPIDDPEAS